VRSAARYFVVAATALFGIERRSARSTMKIAVIGAGAVGGYFGGRLAFAGSEVVFFVRGKTLEALRTGPLRVQSIEGDFEVNVRATDDPGEVGEVDAVLFAVKAWQVPEAAAAIQKMPGEKSVVVPLQNGMNAPAELAAVLGSGRVAGGLCRIVAEAKGPGQIDHYWAEPSLAFGELEPLANAEVLAQLRDAFVAAGVAEVLVYCALGFARRGHAIASRSASRRARIARPSCASA